MVLFMRYEDNIVKVTYTFLKECGIPVALRKVRKYLNGHFYKDSLLSITDLLSELGMSIKAFKTTAERLPSIPVPFIAQMAPEGDSENAFTVVRSVSDGSVCLLNDRNSRWIWVDKEVFLTNWTGITLLAGIGDRENTGESQLFLPADRMFTARVVAQVVAGGLLSVLALYTWVRMGSGSVLAPYCLTALDLTGVMVCLLLVQADLGYINRITGKLCGMDGGMDCQAVLHTRGASIGGMKWSVIGLTYFSSNCLLHTVVLFGFPKAVVSLGIISLLSLGYVIYSLSYQLFVVRKWCALCLTVQLLLILQLALFAGFYGRQPGLFSDGRSILYGLLAMSPVYLAVFYVSGFVILPVYVERKETGIRMANFKNLLFSKPALEDLLDRERAISLPPPGMGIIVGDTPEPPVILKICNPYCQLCAESYPLLMALVRTRPGVRVQIIFLNFTGEETSGERVIGHFLNLRRQGSQADLLAALRYWYSGKCRDYDDLIRNNPLLSEPVDFGAEILQMKEWCQRNEIRETPAFYVYGKRLPELYEINDLKYIF